MQGVLSLLSTNKDFYKPLSEEKNELEIKKPLILQKKILKNKQKNKDKMSLHREQMNKLQKRIKEKIMNLINLNIFQL